MKITIEIDGYRMVIEEADLEEHCFSLPHDIIETGVTPAGYITRKLGRGHISLTGIFKDGHQAQWEGIPQVKINLCGNGEDLAHALLDPLRKRQGGVA